METLLLRGEVRQEIYHQFARVQSMTQWWHWLLLAGVSVIVVAYVVAMYIRDAEELGRSKRVSLLLLRLLAFAGILFFFLDLEKRSQREVVKNSRAVVLVDTSLSMGIQDSTAAGNLRRIEAAIAEFQQGDLLDRLRERHDVTVYRFDQSSSPTEIASLPKLSETASTAGSTGARVYARRLAESRMVISVAGVFLLVSLVSFLIYRLGRRRRSDEETSWAFLVGVVGLMVAVVIAAVAHLRHPEIDFVTALGLRSSQPSAAEDNRAAAPAAAEEALWDVDWAEALSPQGSESRVGDALRAVVQRERGGPLAGVIVVTDGGHNAGVEVQQAAAAARVAQIPVFPIGLGGADRPANIKVVDLEAPARVFPGDSFMLMGYLQSFGLAGRLVDVEIVTRSAQDSSDTQGISQEKRRVRLGGDGEVTSLRFEVVPQQQGDQIYELRVNPPDEDHDPRDDQRSAKVQVVERKNRVLLMAGGPAREFRFLRDLLFRDRDTTLHVHLQSGLPGMSQEADRLLFEFPTSVQDLFEYDCVIAFDVDWAAFSDEQIRLLERWVSEEAGGLVVVAGPVHTPRWASRLRSDPRIDIIKSLYPVVFYSRGSATLSLGRFASETAWPLEFTRDGYDAEFLWLEDDPLLSREAWDSFEGVYGYYAVKDPKPGARVYARFSDPSTAIDGELPIYMAGHFYGAGRVFFQASGEMWRVRAVDDAYFERYYTKLIRWISQGRLLRDSSRGVLMVDKSRCLLGDHIAVRAVLTDAQFQPLLVEQVAATLTDPNGRRQPLVLRRIQDAARAGMFTAQFTATLAGDYRIELQPPHGDSEELLVQEVQSRIPALETERPERNDALLRRVAEQTEGQYFVGFDAAMNRSGAGRAPIYNLIESQDQVSFVAGTPDKMFERVLMTWLMGLICGALCLEWLIRRLSRLA